MSALETRSQIFGYVVSNEGLKVDSDKISAVTSIESPTNEDQSRTILGMFSYLTKFLPEFCSQSRSTKKPASRGYRLDLDS